jgi:ABC-2 type transport system ATP-binding protein
VFTSVVLDGTEQAGDRHAVTVEDMDAVEAVRDRATAAGGEVVDIRTREPSLEEIFLDLAADADPDPRGGS